MKRRIYKIRHKTTHIAGKIVRFTGKILSKITQPLKKIYGKIVVKLPHKYRIRVYALEKRFEKPRVKYTSILVIFLMVLIPVLVYQFRFNDHHGLPWSEKVSKGVWILHNRQPVHQVLAKPKKGPDLKETEASKLNVTNGETVYRWSAKLPSGTKFEFGGVTSNTPNRKVTPEVKITNKDGWFVSYTPKNAEQFVIPKVKGNVIEWQVSDGITARYTMFSDRVKEDFIIRDKSKVENSKVDFNVSSGGSGQKEFTGDLLPDGNIYWDVGTETVPKNIFTFPPPIATDSKNNKIESRYDLIKKSEGDYSLSITLDANAFSKATFPVTVDPVTIDSTSTTTGTAYGNSRKILRDQWGNLIAFFDGGTGNDNVWYKNYDSEGWVDGDIDLDSGAGSAREISADLDSTGSAHLVWRNTTSNAIEYMPLKIIRNGNNEITGLGTMARESIDTSGTQVTRPSIIIANKGGGDNVEKIVIAYNMNGTNRGEVRVITRDIDRGAGYAATILATSGLVGYWRLDETGGTTAFDSSPTGDNGTYTGTYTLNTPGAIMSDMNSPAASFSGTNAYVNIPDNDAYSVGTTNALSIEIWERGTIDALSGDGQTPISKMLGGSNYEWEIVRWYKNGTKGSGDVFHARVFPGTGSTVAIATNYSKNPDTILPQEETWHHIVETIDNVNHVVILYEDGLEVARDDNWTGTAKSNGTGPVRIGARADGSYYFAGQLDEAAIYNRVLTPAEIQSHWDKGTTWKNASEEKFSAGPSNDTELEGGVGLPTSTTNKGTTDAVLRVNSTTSHQAVINQMPGKPRRNPASVKKDMNGTFSNLNNTIDGDTSTVNDINSLTTTSYLYVGDDKPFSKISFDFTKPSTAAATFSSANVQYCSDATSGTCNTWSSVSNFVDNTLDVGDITSTNFTFATDGSVLFDEPVNWVTATVNGTSGKYWIRMRPSATLDSRLNIGEIYINDRNSKALVIEGGVDSTDDLGASYIPWDDVSNSSWENNPSSQGAPWRDGITALNGTGGNWTTFTNFPLSSTVDTKNNRIYVGYIEDLATDVFHVESIGSNKDPTVAANWNDTGFPTITGIASTFSTSLSSDGSDIYAFYVADATSAVNPGPGNLVYARCAGEAASYNGVCDSANDWNTPVVLNNDNDGPNLMANPNVVATKLTSDVVGFDTLFTDTTHSYVNYERAYADLSDRTVNVAASSDDATNSDCTTTDTQEITSSAVWVGGVATDTGCSVSGALNGGVRFPNINVAKGVKIKSAYLDVESYVQGTNPSFTIYGEDVDTAAAFSAVANCSGNSNCIQNRTKTTTSLLVPSKTWYKQMYRFDVTDLVQEIVCRGAADSGACAGNYADTSGNWAAGNAMAMLLMSNTNTGTNNYMYFTSFDDTDPGEVIPNLEINCETSCTASASASTVSTWCQIGTAGGNSTSDCNENWHSRKKVTFNNKASSENLTNFPVLIRLDSSKIDYSKTQDQGQDLRFVDSDGTLLSYEIEKWDESGESLVWVNVPQIDLGSASDYVWVYYNNSAASAGVNASGTWNTNYKAVYHMKEDPSATCSGADAVCDSTSNAINTYMGGSMTSSDHVNGQVGYAIDFDGVNDLVQNSTNITALPSGNSARSMEGWFRTTSQSVNYKAIFGYGVQVDPQDVSFGVNDGSLDVQVRSTGNQFQNNDTVNDGKWHYGVVTYDGTNFKGYVDGLKVGSDYNPATNPNTTVGSGGLEIGVWSDWFAGSLDELRLTNNAESADWIEAEYLNTKPDSTFVNVGSEQDLPDKNTAPSSAYAKEILSTSGLVGYWRLGEATAGARLALDSSTGGNNGTYVNGPTQTTGAILGDNNLATTFTTAQTQYVNIPGLAVTGGAFTYEVWVNGTSFSDFTPLSSSTNGTAGSYIYLVNTDQIGLQANATLTTLYDTNGNINSGWHQVVGTWDGSYLRVYYDGAPVGVPKAFSSALTGTGNVKIGQYGFPSGTYCSCSVDDAAIYNVALTPAQIQKHYLLGRGSPVKSAGGIKKFSKGFISPDSTNLADLGASFSTADYTAVEGDDNNYVVATGDLNSLASTSAVPMFMFKVGNPSNSNNTAFTVTAVAKSTVPMSAKPVYLQIFNGNISNWTTIAKASSASQDTEATLTSNSTTWGGDLNAFYFNEIPGIGTQYAECTDGTANCWLYFRVYQDAPASYVSENLSIDMFDLEFGDTQAVDSRMKGKTRLKGGTRIK